MVFATMASSALGAAESWATYPNKEAKTMLNNLARVIQPAPKVASK